MRHRSCSAWHLAKGWQPALSEKARSKKKKKKKKKKNVMIGERLIRRNAWRSGRWALAWKQTAGTADVGETAYQRVSVRVCADDMGSRRGRR